MNAKWQQPFDADDTSESAFTTALGSGVVVDMMHASTTYDYAETSTCQAVRLPYQGGELSMVVLLPRDETDPVELLNPDVLAAADRGSVEFVADHPFAFAIVHDPTGVPQFEGVVADPS